MGNRESVFVKTVGQARLVLGKNYLLLDNMYFIHAIRRILISIFELYRQLFSISFKNNEIVISRNRFEICHACLVSRLEIELHRAATRDHKQTLHIYLTEIFGTNFFFQIAVQIHMHCIQV